MESIINPILRRIASIAGRPVIFGIDGPCGSGKSTLAAALAARIDCNIIRADDFFLPPAAERGDINCDTERLGAVLADIRSGGGTLTYDKYDCASGQMLPIRIAAKPVTVVEGSYSACPALRGQLDFFVFLDIARDKQLERLKVRDPDKFGRFVAEWIPAEEGYFEKYQIRQFAQKQPNMYIIRN